MQTSPTPERRWWRAAARFARHLLRVNALRAFAIAVLALGVVVWVGADNAVGQAALVVIGTLVSYILLPDEPQRFWRLRAPDLADTVPPSHLRDAGRETAKALALQSGGVIDTTCAATLWDDAVARVGMAVGDPRRVVLDMYYWISVSREARRQLVRTTITSKRCWPGASTVFFSFCSDVAALSAEFASEGSFSREIVELEDAEDLDAWERRVATYPVSLVIDGNKVEPTGRETLVMGVRSRAHRIMFDISDTSITERYSMMQLVAEFHQARDDRSFTVKFSTYFCIGSTQLSLEVDDPSATISINDFMLDPSLDTEFFHEFGLASHRVTLQTTGNAVLHPGSGVVFSWEPGELLTEIPTGLEQLLDEGEPLPISPAIPVSLVPTEGRDEPLVPVDGVRCIDAYHRAGLVDNPRILMARAEVVRRLQEARAALPDGFDFVVLDGWRDRALQIRLVEHYVERYDRSVEGYVADPASTVMRPPHVVGAALDLTIAFQGRPLALGTAFDEFTPAAHLDAFEATDSVVRRLRRLMARALLGAGFAPYPLEWWHWSYGDDVWASFTGSKALYDVVEPAST